MQQAAAYFIGTHDFKSFCAAGTAVKSTVRTIFHVSVDREGDFIAINVTGDGFLYHMVRIIAGTLICVGSGKIKPYAIEDIIKSCNRELAGPTAGPQGLTLVRIRY